MKRIITGILVLALAVLSLTGCGAPAPSNGGTIEIGMDIATASKALRDVAPGALVWRIHAETASLAELRVETPSDLSKPVQNILWVIVDGSSVCGVLFENTGSAFQVVDFRAIPVDAAIIFVSQYEVWSSSEMGPYYQPQH